MVADYGSLVEAKADILDAAAVDLAAEINKKPVNQDDLTFAWTFYNMQHKAFNDIAAKCSEQYVKEKKDSELKTLEVKVANYSKSYIRNEYAYQKATAPVSRASPSPSGASSSSTVDSSLKLLLPKRELPQFSGEVREWLSFWASFMEIDADKNLTDIDKFHYLIQSTKDGSSARKLLQSFPFSAGNYKKALQSLNDRFGRNNVLIKVYVRDLLQMVIESSTGKVVDFRDLVTAITSQIRNLETLGVTQDKCAQVLYPVIESCLPHHVLQAWQRSSSFKEELEELMKFLQSEVNNFTERSLAYFQISGSSNSSGSGKASKQKKPSGEVATSSSFMNNSSGGRNNGNNGGGNGGSSTVKSACVFCDKSHSPIDCRKAVGMSLQTKRVLLKEKLHCFVCLRPASHYANQCRSKAKCTICQPHHFLVMCPNLEMAIEKSSSSSSPPQKMESQAAPDKPPQSPSPAPPDGKSTSMANRVNSQEVPLQTLVVTVHGSNGDKKIIRAIIDPGSQKSYILATLAAELQLKKVGEETVVHQLFGGSTTQPERHAIVKVLAGDKDGNDLCSFDGSTSPRIACKLSSPPPGRWMEEFRRDGVTFTDFWSYDSPIQLLIGNDIAVNLYTSRIHRLGYGPSAMETRWGWVMCGKLPVADCQKSRNSMLVSNLLNVDGHPLSALWELETIGIQDPVETESKKQLEAQTQLHFQKTVTQLNDGRYQVCLPWLTGAKEKLPTNYYAASRRLRATTQNLQVKGYLDKYDSLFKQWEAVGMIEEVKTQDESSCGHYLPHRAVVKLNSATTPIRPVFDGSSKAKGKLSLNDCLDKGPNLLELIPPILTRLRLKRIGITADVEKAFQQIAVAPADRKYLRFLWWKTLNSKEEKIYQHTRVVFGVTSSPYLLAATLRHHLQRATGSEAAVARQLIASTYVDNAILSVDSSEEANNFQQVATALLRPAKMNLRS